MIPILLPLSPRVCSTTAGLDSPGESYGGWEWSDSEVGMCVCVGGGGGGGGCNEAAADWQLTGSICNALVTLVPCSWRVVTPWAT